MILEMKDKITRFQSFYTKEDKKFQQVRKEGFSCRDCDLIKMFPQLSETELPPARMCRMNCYPDFCYKKYKKL